MVSSTTNQKEGVKAMDAKKPKMKRIDWRGMFKGRSPREIGAIIDGMDISACRKAQLKRRFIRGGERLTDKQIAAKTRVVIKSDEWKVKHRIGTDKRKIEYAKQKAKEGRAKVRKIGKKKVLAMILDDKTDRHYRRFLCMYSRPSIPYKEVSTPRKRFEFRVKRMMEKGVTIGAVKRLLSDMLNESRENEQVNESKENEQDASCECDVVEYES